MTTESDKLAAVLRMWLDEGQHADSVIDATIEALAAYDAAHHARKPKDQP